MSIQNTQTRYGVARTALLVLLASFFAATTLAQVDLGKRDPGAMRDRLARQVRYELAMLADHSVFDNLAFRIEGIDGVVLTGQVVRPNLKQDAENAVRSIEAVGRVENKIEVLPLSPSDDAIRRAAFRAIYSQEGLDRYAVRAVHSIHIIVKNGHITLEGVTANRMDKDLAGIAARGVPGAFSVTNNLTVESD
jgi:hyperosmotically inducible protein